MKPHDSGTTYRQYAAYTPGLTQSSHLRRLQRRQRKERAARRR
jgi:hypothetical protein